MFRCKEMIDESREGTDVQRRMIGMMTREEGQECALNDEMERKQR